MLHSETNTTYIIRIGLQIEGQRAVDPRVDFISVHVPRVLHKPTVQRKPAFR